ncbi:hypothetical protein [Lentzea cavernae]|uniref:Uncharacterized protein n=1 Tax=Lentzea cavernae TaxID=2020703 RepID=A0ABQ3MWT8_9PSEU|nr:hypothetical protein [Lentzea cavernae]GHH52091.1 hypothetical protein GCM10017774_63590 [Lentzea cavernae]
MSKTKDLTVRERLVRAGILLPAPRLPEPREAPDEPRWLRRREA